MTKTWRWVLGWVVVCAFPAGLEAQTVRGRVTEEGSGRALPGVDIQLLDASRELVARSAADGAGLYAVDAPAPGNYYVIVDLLGYQRLESPLVELSAGDTLSAAFELPLDPIELEGLRVRADRLEAIKQEVQRFGVNPDVIGERFVDEETIARRLGVRNFGKVLQWQSIPQMTIIDGDDVGSPRPFVCVRLRANSERCAITVLNGSLVTLEMAASIPPEAIEAIAVLDPFEATTMWGTDGGGGAVLIFTHVGR
ncbi:MAG: carboxypeptidase-like regulatory domain-containing protein [Gemmatimonadota bacterium]